MPSARNSFQSFCPKVLGEYISSLGGKGRRHFVTILVGAGFSRSAGIPLASEIIRDLREEAKTHPLLRNAGPPPEGVSEYVHLMEKLGSPKERAEKIKEYIDKARDSEGRLRINWSHLLLASLVEKGYVNRILTTNFDPLVVDALALSGLPIRTYDLNATGSYSPGTLDEATIIYLHGQMHSLFLVNSGDEMKKMADLYPAVLQEAVQDSILIVVGYSGECDPVLDALLKLTNFPRGIWWSQFGETDDEPCNGVRVLSEKFGTDCHWAVGDDSDTFMRKLVLQGMQLDLPDEVLNPLAAMRKALERITPYPKEDIEAGDPVQSTLEMLRGLEELASGTSQPSADITDPQSQDSAAIIELALIPAIEMAALTSDWVKFSKLVEGLTPLKGSRLEGAVADGLIRHASSISETDPAAAVSILKRASNLGPTEKMKCWLPTILGNALSAQGKGLASSLKAKDFFVEAAEKYAEAARINPEMYGAFYNWGNSLFARAKSSSDPLEAKALLLEASSKYAESVHLKPEMHQAFYNWGSALFTQAKASSTPLEAKELFLEASRKYAEAAIIAPEEYETFNNWGSALLARAKISSDPLEAKELFLEASRKYAEAVRIKPDEDGLLNNWGNALSAQAQSTPDPLEAERLFNEAEKKYNEAISIKPESASPHFNLGCLYAIQQNILDSLKHLKTWSSLDRFASRSQIDDDKDFDCVRNDPDFVRFYDTLPEKSPDSFAALLKGTI